MRISHSSQSFLSIYFFTVTLFTVLATEFMPYAFMSGYSAFKCLYI